MKQDLNNEEVFAIPYQYTMDIDNGFTYYPKEKNIWSKYDNLGKYVPKSAIDGKKELQQLAPYVVIRSDNFKYFVLQLNMPKKKEYKNTMTIGITDHIKYEDGLKEPLFKAATRTLLETVNINVLNNFKFRGYVRELDGDINNYLGVVFLLDDIPEDSITVITKDFVGKWLTKKELIEHYAKFEDWSKHLINFMVEKEL